MKNNDLILLVSNDVMPNMGVPVLAPGLRYYYIYKGLKELGHNVKIAIPQHVYERKWKEKYNNEFITFPVNQDYIFYKNNLQKIIIKSKAKYVIFCNAMHGDKIKKIKNVHFIYDMFAPKIFEMICESNNGYQSIDMQSYINRKKLAFNLADGFIVNGKKKLAYIYGFGLSMGRDVTSLPTELIHMAVEADFRESNKITGNIAIAGSKQKWTRYGAWTTQLFEYLTKNPNITLHLLIPEKDKTKIQHNITDCDKIIEKIIELPNTHCHKEKSYAEYVKFLHKMDLVIDVFEKNIEREYAVVSRTVNSLCCGIPVIHSSFTEVSDLISQYNAGWLVDDEGSNLNYILENYHINYEDKVRNAKKLASEQFNYQINAKKIVNLLKRYETN